MTPAARGASAWTAKLSSAAIIGIEIGRGDVTTATARWSATLSGVGRSHFCRSGAVTAEAWLAHQSQICIVARDRGGGYAVAASGRFRMHTGR